MIRYQDSIIKKIRNLRKNELLSYSEISLRVNIPSSTIRNWCYDIPSARNETLIKTNEKRRQELISSEISILNNEADINKNKAKLIVSLLYGCEGSKYPAHSGVSFSNSNPKLIQTFNILLNKAFNLDRNKFHIHLQIHSTQNYMEIKKFWSLLLRLPETCFIKPTIKKPQGGKHRSDYMGTCTFRYNDYRIQLKMLGIYETFLKKIISTAH